MEKKKYSEIASECTECSILNGYKYKGLCCANVCGELESCRGCKNTNHKLFKLCEEDTDDELYLSGINYESIADAEGVSCVLFFSGCNHNCEGCHSPSTHDFKNGILVTDEVINTINEEIDKRPFLSSLVLSGGDPMYSSKKILKLLDRLHIPNNTIWVYSGFTLREIKQCKGMSELLDRCNVLIDGKFELEHRDITLQFRGSSNQKMYKKNEDGEWKFVS